MAFKMFDRPWFLSTKEIFKFSPGWETFFNILQVLSPDREIVTRSGEFLPFGVVSLADKGER